MAQEYQLLVPYLLNTVPLVGFYLKDLHIIVPFAFLLLSFSKFEWAENVAVQACTKKLSGKQICCITKRFF